MPNDPKFDRERLKDLQHRLMHIPAMYGVDQGDVDFLSEALAHIASLEKPVLPEAVDRAILEHRRTYSLIDQHDKLYAMLRSLAAELAFYKHCKDSIDEDAPLSDAERIDAARWEKHKAAVPHAALKAIPEDGKRVELVKRVDNLLNGRLPGSNLNPALRSITSSLLREIRDMLEADARQPASMASVIREIEALPKKPIGAGRLQYENAINDVLAILAKHGTPAPERDETDGQERT